MKYKIEYLINNIDKFKKAGYMNFAHYLFRKEIETPIEKIKRDVLICESNYNLFFNNVQLSFLWYDEPQNIKQLIDAINKTIEKEL